jgi:hypothetical protein
MTEVIHRPGRMNPGELTCAMQMANDKMYSWPVLVRKALNTYLTTRDWMATMFAWGSNQSYRQVARQAPKIHR